MKVNNELTPKQKKVLNYIKRFREKNGYSPTFKEIGKHLGKTVSTVQQYIETLTKKGYLDKQEKVSRGIIPTEKTTEVLLLGEIAAGEPIEPIEIPEQIEVPSTMINSPGNYYALKVSGDSMIEDGILNEDVIIIKHQQEANSGDTIVAITEDGATLKILKKKNGKVYLEPRNKNLKNIYPKELEIRGKFIGLIRR